MTRPVLPDQKARKRAESERLASLLVEAGAGTGKTTTMVRRIISLLTEPDSDVVLSQIVAITFTDRAAQELKDRIRAELSTELISAQGRLHRKLTHALNELEQAPIGTIHSLCRTILGQYPIEAGVDMQFAVADERQASDIREEVWEEWFSQRLRGDATSQVFHAIEMSGINTDDLKNAAFQLVEKRSVPLVPILEGQQCDPVDWQSEIDELQRILELVRQGSDEVGLKRKPNKRQMSAVEEMGSWLNRIIQTDDAQRAGIVLGRIPFSNAKTTEFFLSRVRDIQRRITHPLVLEIVKWLSGFPQAYAERKTRQGLLDFDDLLHMSCSLVRNDIQVRRDLQERFRYIIVDEFQDTDPIQAELIVFLAQDTQSADSADTSWYDIQIAPGKLCVVGDPKQSIYRFRGADIETYSRVADILGRQNTCSLVTNFRSHNEVIGAVNSVFQRDGVFAAHDTSKAVFQPVYEPLEVRPEFADQECSERVQWITRSDTDEIKNVSDARSAEGKLIADAVRSIVEHGWTVRDTTTGEERPVRYGDIAVLYRKGTILDVYERALVAAGVPYHVIGGRTFYQKEEIVRLCSVLSAIDQPRDMISVVAALRSPFFGVSDDDLAQARAVLRSPLNYLDPDESLSESILESFRVLKQLHEMRSGSTPSVVIRQLFHLTAVTSVYAASPYGEQAVANLYKILDEARRSETENGMSFRRFTQHLRTMLRQKVSECESPLEDASDNRIHLQTIHGSKGLEYPIVILIDLAGEAYRSRDLNGILTLRRDRNRQTDAAVKLKLSEGVPICTMLWSGLMQADKAREEAESTRLLYVAMTRARDYLILPKLLEKPRQNTWQHLITECGDSTDWKTWEVDHIPACDAGNASDLPDVQTLLEHRRTFIETRERDIQRAQTARIVKKRPSDHDEFHAPRTEATSEEEPVESASHSEAAVIGTVVHAALENLKPGDEAFVETAVLGAASKENLSDPDALKRAEEMVLKALESDLLARAYRAERIWNEVPIAYTEYGTDEQVEVTRGICDLVFLENRNLVLVDYKTDRLGNGQFAEDKERQYRSQISAYVKGLERTTGTGVTEAWLLLLGSDSPAIAQEVTDFH